MHYGGRQFEEHTDSATHMVQMLTEVRRQVRSQAVADRKGDTHKVSQRVSNGDKRERKPTPGLRPRLVEEEVHKAIGGARLAAKGEVSGGGVVAPLRLLTYGASSPRDRVPSTLLGTGRKPFVTRGQDIDPAPGSELATQRAVRLRRGARLRAVAGVGFGNSFPRAEPTLIAGAAGSVGAVAATRDTRIQNNYECSRGS